MTEDVPRAKQCTVCEIVNGRCLSEEEQITLEVDLI